MSNKTRGIILGILGRLQKDITFDECNRNKTFYDGVKRGIKLSKKAIENIPKEELERKPEKENVRTGYWEQGDMYDIGDVCSACGYDSGLEPCYLSHCPSCHAKMKTL